MLLCLDVGNSNIYAGVYEGDRLLFTFRTQTNLRATSDDLGVSFCGMLKANGVEAKSITRVVVGSVVPGLDYFLGKSCERYFGITPVMVDSKSMEGLLEIGYRNPKEVGADLLLCSAAAVARYPDEPIIMCSLGTATVFCAIKPKGVFLGGVIMPGLRLSLEALTAGTSKLPMVSMEYPEQVIGQSTIECIRSGLFMSQLGGLKEVIKRTTQECFEGIKPVVVATGGYSQLINKEGVFDAMVPTLPLEGLRLVADGV